MAKRRLSQQQTKRIEAAQSAYLAKDFDCRGTVISHQGGRILVELEPGSIVDCKIKSNLGSIVCGDRVALEAGRNNEFRAMAVLDRNNLLQRIDGFGQVRAVAANISQLIVCLSVNPEPNLLLLDQYLLSAEQQNIDVTIVINKIDLLETRSNPFHIDSIYTPLDYPVVATSVTTGEGMSELQQLLRDELSVLSGVSGVGKSSLTSWLLPGEPIKIADISTANDEGRHTTRTSRLYHLPNGGKLIDTPGVRGFSPFIDSERPLAHGFREILQHSADCRFHNCLHLDEPDCAIADAVACGDIAASRYENYLKMLEQTRQAG